MPFTLSGLPVTSSATFEEEVRRAYDALFPGGANKTGMGNALGGYIASVGISDPPADIKAGLDELAAIAVALSGRVQV
jgi:hypothetical protein